jgi:DNA polymerase III delta prime subunit
MNTLVEKYRPKILNDICGNNDIISEIREMIQNKSIPHLLLTGNPGIGKTCIAHAIVNEIFKGNTKFKRKEWNASIDNGIDVIRNDITSYAKHATSQGDIDFQIAILDEADEMTIKAQPALRRLMEIYSKHLRFIIIANNEKKIIKPIKSRCKWFKLENINIEESVPRLSYICEQEKISIDNDAIMYIAQHSNGDVRNAINNYIEMALTESKKHPNVKITVKFLEKSKVKDTNYITILKDALNGKFLQSRQAIISLTKLGASIRQIIEEMGESAYLTEKFPDLMKADIAKIIFTSDRAIAEGANELITVTSFLADLNKIGLTWKNKK